MVSGTLGIGGLGLWELVFILIVFAMAVVLVAMFFGLLLRNKRENIRLRLEVGKLADELERVRKQAGPARGQPSGQST